MMGSPSKALQVCGIRRVLLDSDWQTGPYNEMIACIWLTRSSTGCLAGSAGVPGHALPRHIGNPGMGRKMKRAAGPLTHTIMVVIWWDS